MHQPKSKKILLYLFFFLFIGTLNNKNFNNLQLPKIKSISVSGLNEKDNYELMNNLNYLKIENLFFLNAEKMSEIFNSNNLIEKYSVFKKYPSEINVKIDKTSFLAQIKKGNENFLLGSNGKLIKTKFLKSDIPIIFGNFDNKNFFDLKRALKESNFFYKEIKNLYFFPSGRWDIETHNGILIKLPKSDIKKSLDLLIIFLNTNTKNEITQIDLRQANKIITNGR